ncbi:hypothetical protein V6N13_023730 [Hibiscus sabdariffa]
MTWCRPRTEQMASQAVSWVLAGWWPYGGPWGALWVLMACWSSWWVCVAPWGALEMTPSFNASDSLQSATLSPFLLVHRLEGTESTRSAITVLCFCF